jgi:hypothetical protein
MIVVGASIRGFAYPQYALNNPALAKVVAVAERCDFYRSKMITEHNIPSDVLS